MHGVGIFQRTRAAALAAAATLIIAPAGAGVALAQNRHATMAIDANTGEVLHAQSADEPRYPASLTKMMTLYVTFGEIEAGRLTTDSRIRISEAAASVAPSKLELDPGSDIALIDAMKALVTKSANDIAVAIAERIAGSEEAFAKLMTDRARQIGMRSTTFRNASGLPNDEQVTTARDMLTLALRLQDDYPKLYRLFSLKYFTYNGDTHRNHNSLLFHYAGTEGIKTGYTRASGFNLVTSVKRDGKHVVAAVFGGQTAGTRNAQMRAILTRVFAKASSVKTRKPAPMLIARPKPAPRPVQVALKAEPRPAPRPIIAKATLPPKPVVSAAVNTVVQPAKSVAPAAVAPVVVALPAPPVVAAAPVIVPEPAVPPPFEIAMVKVRPSTLPTATAPLTVLPVVASLAPKLDFKALNDAVAASRETAPAPTAPPAATETIVTKSMLGAAPSVRAPGTLDQQLAVIAAAPSPRAPVAVETAAMRPQSVAPASPVATAPAPQQRPSKAVLGTPPSTLSAQAARLAPQTTVTPQHLGGPVSAGGANYEIQIGTFVTAAEADARLAAVQGQTASLAGYAAMALPFQDGGRMVYRARFAGFDGQRATNACLELRRAGVDCFVAKPE